MAHFSNKLNQVRAFILDLIWPKQCIACKNEGSYLCRLCFEKLPVNERFFCALCHGYSPGGRICLACQKETALRAIWVAADYNNKIVQDLIHNFKYNYLEELGAISAKLMMKYWQVNKIAQTFTLSPADTIFIPVPLHKKRYLSRGFNQSEILAATLSHLSQIKTANWLIRQKNTPTQINLPRLQRQINVQSAFSLAGNVPLNRNKKIVLIDDVITTGSTLKECALVLAKAGYQEIYGFVIAQKED